MTSIELVFVAVALGSWLVIISFIVLIIVIWKMCHELIALTESIKNWIEIYFPPHVNEATKAPAAVSPGKTSVTVNPAWDEGEPPRD